MGKLIGLLGTKVGLGWANFIVYGIVLSIVAGFLWKAYDWAYDNGFNASETAWQARDNEELRTANALINRLQDEARRNEQAHSEQLVNISKEYEDEAAKIEARTERRIAELRNAGNRLRDPYAAPCESTGTSPTGPPTTGPSERDEGTAGELSREASTFLLNLTGESDEVVKQLQACQAVVVEDRRLCGVTTHPQN